MKKILIVILLAGLTVTIFYACKKNTEPVQSNSNTEQLYSDNGIIVYNKLVNFKYEMQNSQKSATLMTIDSAQWYVEAYYNVTSGYPDSAHHKFDVDSATYSLPVDENNMISVVALSVLMGDLESDLNTSILQYGNEDAHMVVGNVSINLTSRSSEAEVVVTTGFGLGGGSLYTPFSNEEWYYGETAGRCDTPTTIYSDAGEELEWRFNNPNPVYVPVPTCGGGIKIIQTNMEHWSPGTEINSIYSEWLAIPKTIPCHDSPYWNNYLNNGFNLFYHHVQNGGLIPDGNYFFTSVDIVSLYVEEEDQYGNDGYTYYHGYNVFYSEYECLPDIN